MSLVRTIRAKHLLSALSLGTPLLVAAPASAEVSVQPTLPFWAMPIDKAPPRPPTQIPAASGRLVYHGGAVISNAKVYQVNWGSGVWSKAQSDMAGFFKAVGASAYFDWLGSQYDTAGLQGGDQHIGQGSFGGSYTISPSVSGNVSNDQVAQELVAQIQSGKLPQPDLDAHGHVDALYFFFFPAGVSINLQGAWSCQYFYGYHYTVPFQGKNVPYAVIPDFSQDCQGGFDEMLIASSHELIEAVTDAEVGVNNVAWNSDQDGGQEIGDLCNGQASSIAGYTVQTEWSNHDNGCVTTSSYRLPVCSTSQQPPNCRACTAADEGKACTGATPHCDQNPKDSLLGQCVACAQDSHCNGSTPICDASSRTCRACSSNNDCSGTTPACATTGTSTGKCVQCTADAQCSGTTPVCDSPNNACVQCNVDSDCKDQSLPSCSGHLCVAKSGGGGGGGGGSGGGSGGSWGSGSNNDNSGGGKDGFGDSSSGCGCVTAGQTGDYRVLALVAGVAGSVIARRRRRQAR